MSYIIRHRKVSGPSSGTGTSGTSGLTTAQVQALIDTTVAPINTDIAALEADDAADDTQFTNLQTQITTLDTSVTDNTNELDDLIEGINAVSNEKWIIPGSGAFAMTGSKPTLSTSNAEVPVNLTGLGAGAIGITGSSPTLSVSTATYSVTWGFGLSHGGVTPAYGYTSLTTMAYGNTPIFEIVDVPSGYTLGGYRLRLTTGYDPADSSTFTEYTTQPDGTVYEIGEYTNTGGTVITTDLTIELMLTAVPWVVSFPTITGNSGGWKLQTSANGSTWVDAVAEVDVDNGDDLYVRAIDSSAGTLLTSSTAQEFQKFIFLTDSSSTNNANNPATLTSITENFTATVTVNVGSISQPVLSYRGTQVVTGVATDMEYNGWVRVTVSGWHSGQGSQSADLRDAFYRLGTAGTAASGGLRGDFDHNNWTNSGWTNSMLNTASDANGSGGRYRLCIKKGSTAWTGNLGTSGYQAERPANLDQYPIAQKYSNDTTNFQKPSFTNSGDGPFQWTSSQLGTEAIWHATLNSATAADNAAGSTGHFDKRIIGTTNSSQLDEDWDNDGTDDHRIPRVGDHQYVFDYDTGITADASTFTNLWFRPWHYDPSGIKDEVIGSYFITVQAISAEGGTVTNSSTRFQ
jgi:hypothetical protein